MMAGDMDAILNLLLDRYERSRHYHAPGASPRGVFIKYDPATFPEYWDELRGDRRMEINLATQELVARGLVLVRSTPYSRDEIERVDLNLERLSDAYALAGRTSRRHQEEKLAEAAQSWASRWPDSKDWRRPFCLQVLAALAGGDALPAGLRHDSSPLFGEVCRILEHLGPAGLPDEVPRRIFSQRALGNSKRFEEMQGTVARVLREFWPGALPADDRDALSEVGVVENPQHVFVAGPVKLDGLDIGAVGAEVGLPAAFIERCRVTAVEADKFVTVENLTSFHQLVRRLPARTLAVYLGGYHNRTRRRLLLKLAASGVGRFRHWGDIDLGGFRIYAHLRRMTDLPLQPWLMDVETYRNHSEQGKPFSASYGRALEALLCDPQYDCFHEVITEMLRHGRSVEQEAVDP